jgi:hypothetical protein
MTYKGSETRDPSDCICVSFFALCERKKRNTKKKMKYRCERSHLGYRVSPVRMTSPGFSESLGQNARAPSIQTSSKRSPHSFCFDFDHESDLQAPAYAIIWIKRRLDSESPEPFALPNRFLIDVALLCEGW